MPCQTVYRSMGLNQGGVNEFPGGAIPQAQYNIESLINKFTKQCVCFYNFFIASEGLETKDKYLKVAW